MLNKLKRIISKLKAELHAMSKDGFVLYSHTNENNVWEYSIADTETLETIYKTKNSKVG